MFARGDRQHAVDESVAEPFQDPGPQVVGEHRRPGHVEAALDSGIGGVDLLAARATGSGEPPAELVLRDHDAGTDFESSRQRRLLFGRGRATGAASHNTYARPVKKAIALLRATHPEPTAAVTLFCTATALAAGLGIRSVLLAAAVLAGQLSVGWSNDALDVARDRAARRSDKPLPRGDISRRTAWTAAAAASGACVPLSLSLGGLAGATHLVAVASAWSYNLRLKFGLFSWLPYLVSFSLVPPVFVALALPGNPPPRPLLVAAGGVLGVAAHFANTVPDALADARTHVRGLPQRIGPRRSALVSSALVAVGSVLLLTGTRAAGFAVLASVLATAVAAGSALLVRSGRSTAAAFRLALIAIGVLVLGFVVSGGHHLVH